MPKTTTAAFDKEWADRGKRNAVWKVTYKRLYWNGSAYVLESSARTLYPRDIEKISPISWKTDEAQESRFLASNVTLYIRNKGESWLPENLVDSIWKPDATATLGYEPYLSWFQVHYGYLLPDGTSEYLALFTGYSEVPRFNSETGLAEIRLVGREIKLEAAKGSQVSNTFTNASAGTGDGATLRFSTGQKSVFEVSQVRVGAVVKTQGTHYTLESLNNADNLCYIVFTAGNAPANLAAVDWTGRQWKRLSSVSTVAGLLCDAAGITSGERTIEEPNWPTVGAYQLFDSQTSWQTAATKGEINTVGSSGSVKGFVIEDWSDGDYSMNPTWTEGGGTSGYSISGGKLVTTSSPGGFIYASPSTVLSSYTTSGTMLFSGMPLSGVLRFFVGWSSFAGIPENFNENGHYIEITGGTLYFKRWAAIPVTLLSASAAQIGAQGTVYKVSVSGVGGTWEVSYNYGSGWTSLGTCTDATDTNSFGTIRIQATGESRTEGVLYTTETTHANAFSTTASEWISAEIDLGAAPAAWNTLTSSLTSNNGTATLAMNVSATGGGVGYDGWVTVANGAVPSNNLKQYVKLRVRFTLSAGYFYGAVVDSLQLNYLTSNLFLQHADFTGMNARQALDELAVLANMEHGFNGDGTYFFRNKETTPSYPWTLDLKNALASVPEVDPGTKEVRNVIQATYNHYFYEYNSTTAAESSPTSQQKNGDRVEQLSLDRFAFANGVSLVQAAARKVYNDRSVRKRRIRSEGRIIPAMNLGDGARLSAIKTPLLEKNIFGDEHQTNLGDMGSATAGPSNVLLRDVPAKVIGATFDVMRSRQQTFYREVV